MLTHYVLPTNTEVKGLHPSQIGNLFPQDAAGHLLTVEGLNASSIRAPLLSKAVNGMLNNPMKINLFVPLGHTFDSDCPKLFCFETQVSANDVPNEVAWHL